MKKRIIAAILSLVIALTYCTAAYAVNTEEESTAAELFNEEKTGDADNNGKVTADDARLILRCSTELEAPTAHTLLYCDFDKDGALSASDARTALRISVGLDCVKCILHGHSLTEKTTAASCTEDGVYSRICTRCSHKEEIRITEKAKGHLFGIWQPQGEAKSRVCSSCGFTETAKNAKTIYLTFDDGPGPYTARLLSYLKEYGVRATFFVTNQMPRYRYLLKDIVNDGHAIAVHTLTHQWSIYSGKTSYLNDFNAMHKIILDDTGVDTKIFRFPGGTNNTVSRSYSRGIMSAMAKHMTDSGYVYFDWNVDCGDTLGYSSSRIASYTIAQIKNRHSSVVLMHDIKSTTVEAVRAIIKYGLDNGYEFAVIDESTPRVQFRPVN